MNKPAGCSCPSNRNPGDDDGTKCRSQVRAGVAVKSQSQVARGWPSTTHSISHSHSPKLLLDWCRPAVFGSNKWRVVGLIGTVRYPYPPSKLLLPSTPPG